MALKPIELCAGPPQTFSHSEIELVVAQLVWWRLGLFLGAQRHQIPSVGCGGVKLFLPVALGDCGLGLVH